MAIVSPKYDVLLDEIVMQPIPQVDADPSPANPEEAWVLHTTSGGGGSGAGEAYGLLLSLTQPGSDPLTHSYTFKYRTKENTTKSVALT